KGGAVTISANGAISISAPGNTVIDSSGHSGNIGAGSGGSIFLASGLSSGTAVSISNTGDINTSAPIFTGHVWVLSASGSTHAVYTVNGVSVQPNTSDGATYFDAITL